MLKIAVIDDEVAVAAQTERCLLKAGRELQLDTEVDVFGSGEEAIQYLGEDTGYHIIFLDIEMGECSGIEVSRFLRDVRQDESVQIVYVSGKNGYDRQLFEFRPFCFLEKPVDEEDLQEVLEKYIRIYGVKQDVLEYTMNYKTHFMRLSFVLYFESIDRKIKIKTLHGEEIFYGSIQKLLDQLEASGFFMPHKSYLVNYRMVKVFHLEYLEMINGDKIPIAKGSRKDIARLQLKLENGGMIQ